MKYDAKLATKYWEERIAGKGENLAGVLYYSESEFINKLYDIWEKSVILRGLKNRYSSILDVPVGIGRWTKELFDISSKLYCVDLSEEILEVAKKKVCCDNPHNVKFIVSNVNEIDLHAESLELILCTGLFEHLPTNEYLNAIDKFANLLKIGGELILVINNKNSKFLNITTDNLFRKDAQLENGYFNALTDVDKVIAKLNSSKFEISHYSINPNFSVIRKNIDCKKVNDDIIALCSRAINNDIEFFSNIENPFDHTSDQIVIWCKKR